MPIHLAADRPRPPGLPDPRRERQPQRHDLPPRPRRWRTATRSSPSTAPAMAAAACRLAAACRSTRRPRCSAARSPQSAIERPSLVGHSYGGSVALAWAVDAPETVSGLVLLATPSQVWEGGLGLTNDLLASPLVGPPLARGDPASRHAAASPSGTLAERLRAAGAAGGLPRPSRPRARAAAREPPRERPPARRAEGGAAADGPGLSRASPCRSSSCTATPTGPSASTSTPARFAAAGPASPPDAPARHRPHAASGRDSASCGQDRRRSITSSDALIRYTNGSSIHRFFSAPGLCAAFLPDLSLSTMNCGASSEAATLCPLMRVSEVCFSMTLPCVSPWLVSQATLVALLEAFGHVRPVPVNRCRPPFTRRVRPDVCDKFA